MTLGSSPAFSRNRPLHSGHLIITVSLSAARGHLCAAYVRWLRQYIFLHMSHLNGKKSFKLHNASSQCCDKGETDRQREREGGGGKVRR